MNLHLLTSGVRGLAPDGVPRGKAPWPFATVACLLASIAVGGCALLQGRTGSPEPPADVCTDCPDAAGTHVDASPIPLRDKLGAHLLALVERHVVGDIARASSYAKSTGVDLREGRVSVQVLAASDQDLAHLEQRIKNLGGSVRSRFENSIFAAIPLRSLSAFAAEDAVWRIDAERRVFSPQMPNGLKPKHTWEENQ